MAATFVVEDGSIVAGANSYVTLADAQQYVDNTSANAIWDALLQAPKEKSLRMATQFIDQEYHGQWKGLRVDEDQTLDWPRSGVVDRDGYDFDYESIPQKLQDAVCEAAVDYAVNGTLMPDVGTPGGTKRVKAGPVEKEYFTSDFVKLRRLIDALVEDMIIGGNELRRA